MATKKKVKQGSKKSVSKKKVAKKKAVKKKASKKKVVKKKTAKKKAVKKPTKKKNIKRKVVNKSVKNRPVKKKSSKKSNKPTHTIKTKKPEVHHLGHIPKTAHDKFTAEVKKHHAKPDPVEEMFLTGKWSFKNWLRKYSPVIITLGIGLLTYIYLVFYMFYPTAVTQGHYLQFLIIILFIFLIAGVLVFLGLKSELLFVRILSFIFVFVIFTFLLLFVLVAYALNNGAV